MPRRNHDHRRATLRRLNRRRWLDQLEERPPNYQEIALDLVRAGKASPAILGPLRVAYHPHHHSPKENAA